MTSCRTEA